MNKAESGARKQAAVDLARAACFVRAYLGNDQLADSMLEAAYEIRRTAL